MSTKLHYSADLFSRSDAERMAARFCELLGSALENPAEPVRRLRMLPDDEAAEVAKAAGSQQELPAGESGRGSGSATRTQQRPAAQPTGTMLPFRMAS